MADRKKTSESFLSYAVFNGPIFALYTLLVFIFCKELHASPFQITLIIASKPVSAILSFYWSSWIHKRPERVKRRLMWTHFLGLTPTLFFPFIEISWFYIVAFALHVTSYRAIIPGWMEILKKNLPLDKRSKLFSYGASINYSMGMFLPLLFSQVLDRSLMPWQWLYFLSALFSCLNLLFMMRIPYVYTTSSEPSMRVSLSSLVVEPWKKCWKLMRERTDFAHFQVIFMLGGLGLMVMQPALPIFFVSTLNFSYTEMALAISACKGIGFLLTSRIWAAWFSKLNIYLFNGVVTLFASLFPLFVILGLHHVAWVYFAFLLYGTMQAGSEMSWNLSGPVFSGEKDSSSFTGINVVLVGLRGCVGPALGGFLCSFSGSTPALLLGGFFCIVGACYGLFCNKKVAILERSY
jgi:hypothetical protein